MTGGIGDFSVSAGKAGSGGVDNRPGALSRPAGPTQSGSGNPHYIVMMKNGWEQASPLRFHNGHLDELRHGFKLTAKVPLPEMPNFFPAGAEGEMSFHGRNVLHLDSALREQPLFSHLENLRDLVQRVSNRKIAFPDFVADLNRIPIPPAWRNEIVNGLFEHARQGVSSAPEKTPPGLSGDIEKLMALIEGESTGGSKLSPHLGKFLEEVGRDSTGFTLRDGAAKRLHLELDQTLAALRGSLIRHGALADVLGFMSSLQRLARAAKGRERQTVHLWSHVPEDPRSLILGENADDGADFAAALVLLDPLERGDRSAGEIAALAGSLGCPLLVQCPGEDIPSEALAESGRRDRTFFFAGGVASRVEGDVCVLRPAVLAFLEGLVSSRENVDYYLHRAMVLEDQDLITENGRARSSDRLLDQSQVDLLSGRSINRVNGARNRSIAAFPLLTPWEGA